MLKEKQVMFAPTGPFVPLKLRYLLWVAYFLLLFLVLVFPLRAITYDAANVASQRLINYQAFYQAERTADGRNYAWLRPEAQLFFNDVPRYAPLRFEIELNFDRPPGAPPGQLEVSESRSREPGVTLATLQADPQRPGFQRYVLTIPPCQTCETGLLLELKANGFRPAGDSRTLGVVTGEYRLELGKGHYRYLLWPQPYLIGVILAGLVLVGWLIRTGTGLVAGLLWLTGPALCFAVFTPVLYDDSWWIITFWILDFGFWIVAPIVFSRFRLRNFDKDLEVNAQPKISRTAWGEKALVPGLLLLAAILAVILAVVPLYATDIKDLQLYQGWIKDLQREGLFNIYSKSPNLDYLPLLLYLLWLFNLITAPFGLSGDALTLKLFFALPVLVNIWILGKLLASRLADRSTTTQTQPLSTIHYPPSTIHHPLSTQHLLPPPSSFLLLTGVTTTLLFNAATWGQTDTLLACMLGWTFIALWSDKPIWAGVLLGLDVALKPQSWVVAPLLALFLVQKFGWRKGLQAGGLGLLLLFGLSAPAFGFDPASFSRFLFQPAFAGELNLGSVNAYNLLYLLGYGTKEAPNLIAWCGFALIGLVYLLVIAKLVKLQGRFLEKLKLFRRSPRAWLSHFRQEGKRLNPSLAALAAGPVMLIFFLSAIKMRERYLEYGLWFVGLATVYASLQAGKWAKSWLLAFLGLDVLSMLNLLPVFVMHRNSKDYNTVYLWRSLLLADWLPSAVAVGITAIFLYLLLGFLRLSPDKADE